MESISVGYSASHRIRWMNMGLAWSCFRKTSLKLQERTDKQMDCSHIRFMIDDTTSSPTCSSSLQVVFPYGALNQEPTRHLWTKLHQVHKCVAQVGITAEVHGKIHEIIELTEALFVQQGQEHVAGVVVGQVAQHHLNKSQDGVALRKFCVFVHCTMSSAPFGPCMYVFCDFFSSRTIQPQPCTLFHINYSCIFEAPWYVGLCCRTPHLSQPCLLSPATCIISENSRSHQEKRKNISLSLALQGHLSPSLLSIVRRVSVDAPGSLMSWAE